MRAFFAAALFFACSACGAEFQDGVGRESLGVFGLKRLERLKTLRGGLAFRADVEAWPQLNRWTAENSTGDWTGESFGAICPSAGVEPAVKIRAGGDWTHERWRYEWDSGSIDFLISRLFPGFLIEGRGSRLLMFADLKQPEKGRSLPLPARLAYAAEGRINIHGAPAAIDAPPMSEAWILVWYGPETRLRGWPCPPDTQRGDAGHRQFLIDIPWLIVFENRPLRLALDGEGLSALFDGEAGRVVMMPLYGVRELFKGDTVSWDRALPADVLVRCRRYAAFSRYFPLSVKESFRLGNNGAVTIKEEFEFSETADAWKTKGVKLAPLPPAVETARRYGFPLELSGEVSEFDHILTGGLWAGVENADAYEFTVPDVGRYVAERLPLAIQPGTEAVAAKLAREAERLLSAQWWAPYRLVCGKFGGHELRCWVNPAETYYTLALALPLLPEQLREQVKDYMRAAAETLPPLEAGGVPDGFGERRERYVVPKGSVLPQKKIFEPALFNLYAAWAYAEATEEWDAVAESMDVAEQTLNMNLTRRFDWALGWGGREGAEAEGAAEVNEALAGLIGYARLCERLGDKEKRDYAHYLLARVMLTRYALSKYVFAVYDAKQRVIPPIFAGTLPGACLIDDTACVPDPRCANWAFQLHIWYSPNTQQRRPLWTCAADDLGQVVQYDEHRVTLASSGKQFPYRDARLPALERLVPETGRFLRETCRDDVARYCEGLVALWPDWFCIMHEDLSTTEGAVFPLEVAWALFCAQTMVLDADAESLAAWTDIPMCAADLYYIQKLALAAGRPAMPAETALRVERCVTATTVAPFAAGPVPRFEELPLHPDSMVAYAPPGIFASEEYNNPRYTYTDYTAWPTERLLQHYRSAGASNREGAMCELARRQFKGIIPELIKAVERQQPGGWWSGEALTAMRCLAHMKAVSAIPALVEKLGKRYNVRVRAEAARALGFMPEEYCIDALLPLVSDTDETPVVRFCAAVALSQHDAAAAAPVLEAFSRGADALLAQYARSWLEQVKAGTAAGAGK